jgi:hypothetical protein
MARTTKYDWPDDQTLQALLDVHGTVETARHVGCPPSSLSSRIRQRGLRGSKPRQASDGVNGNGKLDAPNGNGNPDVRNGNGSPDPANEHGPGAADGTEQPASDSAHGERDAADPSKEPLSELTGPGADERAIREGSEPERKDSPGAKPQNETQMPLARRPIRKPAGKPRPDSRNEKHEQLAQLGSADHLVRDDPRKPDPVGARPSYGYASHERPGNRPALERPRPDWPVVEAPLDSAPARDASRPRRALALLRRVPPPIWRLLAVLALAAVAALAAFISVSNDPKEFQRDSSFAVRPSSDVPPAAVNDVLGTLAQPDSAITETIVNMLGSPRLRDFAAQSAGVPAGSVGGSGAQYVWTATRRTGSTIIDLRLTGPDEGKLLAMQTAAAPEAARLVEESYSPYRLETLSAPTPATQVGPKVARTVGLALLLGALLGLTLVLVERRLRSSVAQREGPIRAPAERGESWGR